MENKYGQYKDFQREEIINDINYDLNSKPYTDLALKLKTKKKAGNYFLLKLNSHPVAGKSTFVRKYAGNYSGCKLIDFDSIKEQDRKNSSILLTREKHSVLLGTTGGGLERPQGREDDIDVYEEVVYIFVMPKLVDLYRNIVHRQIKEKNFNRWNNPSAVLKYRNNVYSHIVKDNIQIKPLFYSFEAAIDFCIQAYNE